MTVEIPACGRCGSTTLHHKMFGLPTPEALEEEARRPGFLLAGCCVMPGDWITECVTCGQRERIGASGQSDWTTASRPSTPALITAYAAAARQALDVAQAPAISYCGLWLLLASFAASATDSHRAQLQETLGVPCEEAAGVAADLLAAPHPTIAAALGGWSRSTTPFLIVDEIPDQPGFDSWASDQTRGLINQFPLVVGPEIALVLATALVLQPQWTAPMQVDENGLLVLKGGLQTIVSTDSAGLVAVAKPFSEDGVDVVSVIAAPEVSPQACGRRWTK